MYGGDNAQCHNDKILRRRHLLAIYFLPTLFIIFGMSSWLSINTIWVEMPLLAVALPEAWDLPAYVTVLIQFGNIGPLAMIALRNKNRYAIFIYLIISLLIAANLTLAFVFKITLSVAGANHSVVFFILAFVLALCDCTSNVTFLPYLANFNPRYLVYFFVGQGMGGLVPSALGLSQGSGSYRCVVPNGTNATTSNGTIPVYSPPRFDFNVFLFAAVGVLAAALCAFILIEITLRRLKRRAIEEAKAPRMPSSIYDHVTPISEIIRLPQLDPFAAVARSHATTNPASVAVESAIAPRPTEDSRTSQGSGDDLLNESLPVVAGHAVTSPTLYDAIESAPQGTVFQEGERTVSSRLSRLPFKRKTYSSSEFIPDYILNGYICFMINGLLPSIQSFSALAYGQLIYSLVACLWVAAVPIASWMTMCIKIDSIRWLYVVGSTSVVPSAYVLMLAFLCPVVPLQQDAGGYFLAVFAWFMASAVFIFTRVSVAQRVQRGGHKALFWFGLSTQGASLLGAVVAFLLIPVFHVFRDPKLC